MQYFIIRESTIEEGSTRIVPKSNHTKWSLLNNTMIVPIYGVKITIPIPIETRRLKVWNFMERIVWTYIMVWLSSQKFQICMNDFITNNSFLNFYGTKLGIVKQRILSTKSLHKDHDQPTVNTLLRVWFCLQNDWYVPYKLGARSTWISWPNADFSSVWNTCETQASRTFQAYKSFRRHTFFVTKFKKN